MRAVVHAYYLAGDSYPRDRHVEAAVATRLRDAGVETMSQDQLDARSGPGGMVLGIQARAQRLERAIEDTSAPDPPFIIGRSSGGSVAVEVARRRPIAGVICLGFPFRAPGRVLDPARFAALAEVQTPTLIIQGERDRYGGLDLTEHYALSPAVSLRFASGGHRFELSAGEWDEVAGWITAFIAGGLVGQTPKEDFDEAFYLRTHPDVAQAVAEGRFISGAQHLEHCGREEGRAYRLSPRSLGVPKPPQES